MVNDLIDIEKRQRDPDDMKDGSIEALFLFDRSIDLVYIKPYKMKITPMLT
jgi:hypothetical protein